MYGERGSIFVSLLWPSLGLLVVVFLLYALVALALQSRQDRHL